jgi:hypothetical protein
LNYKNSREHVAAILSTKTAYVPSPDPAVLYQSLVDIARYARNLEELLAVSATTSMDLLSSPPSIASEDNSNSSDTAEREPDVTSDGDGVFVDTNLTDPLRQLALRAPISGADQNYRFFGKSSTMNFIKSAVEYAGAAYTFDAQRPEFWILPPVRATFTSAYPRLT